MASAPPSPASLSSPIGLSEPSAVGTAGLPCVFERESAHRNAQPKVVDSGLDSRKEKELDGKS